MPEAEQLELIDAHPAAGCAARDRLDVVVPRAGLRPRDHRGRWPTSRVLNAAYEARFGFRFCVFVNGRSRPALVPVLEGALGADREAEILRALHDVVAIARDRYEQAAGPAAVVT